jgi:hypothetical protein
MKKSVVMLLSLIFILSCAKEQSLLRINEINPNESDLITNSFVGIGVGSSIENPIGFTNASVLPSSIISFINPSYVAQLSVDTIHTLTPNSSSFSNGSVNLFDAPSYALTKCPLPKPSSIRGYSHTFFCPTCEGGEGKPGCPIMDEIFPNINFGFRRISASRLVFEIYYKDGSLLYSKNLTITSMGSRTYTNQGSITSLITTNDIDNYLKYKDKATTTVIITKFFNFFNTQLITSN